ncbi:hypothetical protein NMQ14_03295 [Methyloversatilis sp. XJ19-13]|uniref:hypothetical protein n=1 Tax=Methyloversatilis sp. XJ19-13 TaxID=2963430 RepID=UPI00211CDB94|nr:hypothetical protein [Methyloversatilis sp. XJ19-13]MCQ9373270.1 hypothetical protein [Methyloversatilis sp. XJ19-13]
MSLDLDDFDFRDWGLRMGRLEGPNGDMDLVLWQGDCPNCGDDAYVRLNPCHFAALANELSFVTAPEAAHAVERMQDRLTLLVALVRSQCPPGNPLRAAVDALATDSTTPASDAALPGTSCPPALGAEVASPDLFAQPLPIDGDGAITANSERNQQ